MKLQLFLASSRGRTDHGWLKTHYSFSFAEYYNPERMGFGVLRVLNDDWIAPGGGFPMHSHADMEIITVPFSGALEHRDSIGGHGVIKTGDVQVMSAGTGVTHSEFNASQTEPITLFQVWIEPKERNVAPRYDQKTFGSQMFLDDFRVLVGPDESDGRLMIHQDAWLSTATLASGKTLEYHVRQTRHGVYLMVIEGEIVIEEETLGQRDAAGITGAEHVMIQAQTASRILAIEVPMF